MHFFSPPVSILGTRCKTVLFPKLADAFLMMYQTSTVGIFTNIGAFGGFCHGNPVSIERVQSGDFGIEKARKRRISKVFIRIPLHFGGICGQTGISDDCPSVLSSLLIGFCGYLIQLLLPVKASWEIDVPEIDVNLLR